MDQRKQAYVEEVQKTCSVFMDVAQDMEVLAAQMDDEFGSSKANEITDADLTDLSITASKLSKVSNISEHLQQYLNDEVVTKADHGKQIRNLMNQYL